MITKEAPFDYLLLILLHTEVRTSTWKVIVTPMHQSIYSTLLVLQIVFKKARPSSNLSTYINTTIDLRRKTHTCTHCCSCKFHLGLSPFQVEEQK
jgi:hypothetical protein